MSQKRIIGFSNCNLNLNKENARRGEIEIEIKIMCNLTHVYCNNHGLLTK